MGLARASATERAGPGRWLPRRVVKYIDAAVGLSVRVPSRGHGVPPAARAGRQSHLDPRVDAAADSPAAGAAAAAVGGGRVWCKGSAGEWRLMNR